MSRSSRRLETERLRISYRSRSGKIYENPDFGKPLRYGLKGEWSIYVKPHRLIYKVEGDKLILLRFEHRREVYER